MSGFDGGESPDEAASASFYASLEEESSGAMVMSDISGHVFWIRCGLCLGDEIRKAPKRYRDKQTAQVDAALHNVVFHKINLSN